MSTRGLKVTAVVAIVALVGAVLALGLTTGRGDASRIDVTASRPGVSTATRCTSNPVVVSSGSTQLGPLTSVSVAGLDTAACSGRSLQVQVRYANFTSVATSAAGTTVTGATQTVALTGASGLPAAGTPGSYVETATVTIGGFAVPATWGPDKHIRSQDGTKPCLTAGRGATPVADGTAVYLDTPCSDTAAQRWTFSGSTLKAFGLCLTLGTNASGVATESAPTEIRTCVPDDPKQTWFLTANGELTAVQATLGAYPVHPCLFNTSTNDVVSTRSCADSATNVKARWTGPPLTPAACTTSTIKAVTAVSANAEWVQLTGLTNAGRLACNGLPIRVALYSSHQELLGWSPPGQTVDARSGDGSIDAPQLVDMTPQSPTIQPTNTTIHHAYIAIDGRLVGPASRDSGNWQLSATSTGTVKVAQDGQCLTSSGAALTTAACGSGLATQRWTYDGFTLKQGTQCVDPGAGAGEGVQLKLAACTDGARQMWLRAAATSAYVSTVRVGAGLDVASCMDRDGATRNVQLWGCYAPTQQQWTLPTP